MKLFNVFCMLPIHIVFLYDVTLIREERYSYNRNEILQDGDGTQTYGLQDNLMYPIRLPAQPSEKISVAGPRIP